eukprot:CAMPEP_0196576512 /NCGR_PEP_ID=MMETSP1081-20130531/5745_1 /TAXON_ID=36882 /ORGANISM="Pyramimonas amylifera, Strain CCMP720" /LENGTH=535 /DNA_ID=CAMNT_0041895131 /DNA_START=245 /DNA_END=1852 /DNA_ORIENTATION=-
MEVGHADKHGGLGGLASPMGERGGYRCERKTIWEKFRQDGVLGGESGARMENEEIQRQVAHLESTVATLTRQRDTAVAELAQEHTWQDQVAAEMEKADAQVKKDMAESASKLAEATRSLEEMRIELAVAREALREAFLRQSSTDAALLAAQDELAQAQAQEKRQIEIGEAALQDLESLQLELQATKDEVEKERAERRRAEEECQDKVRSLGSREAALAKERSLFLASEEGVQAAQIEDTKREMALKLEEARVMELKMERRLSVLEMREVNAQELEKDAQDRLIKAHVEMSEAESFRAELKAREEELARREAQVIAAGEGEVQAGAVPDVGREEVLLEVADFFMEDKVEGDMVVRLQKGVAEEEEMSRSVPAVKESHKEIEVVVETEMSDSEMHSARSEEEEEEKAEVSVPMRKGAGRGRGKKKEEGKDDAKEGTGRGKGRAATGAKKAVATKRDRKAVEKEVDAEVDKEEEVLQELETKDSGRKVTKKAAKGSKAEVSTPAVPPGEDGEGETIGLRRSRRKTIAVRDLSFATSHK